MTQRFLLLFISLQIFKPVPAQIITTVAGNGNYTFSGDGGPALNASFQNAISLALDIHGNIFVSDLGNNRIRKIDKVTGIISTIAGTGVAGFSGDGGPATAAEIHDPSDLCIDSSGNIYFCDNQNFRIRKIDPAGIITTVVGDGTANYSGQTMPALNAGIHYPTGIATDGRNLYISLFTKQRICKIDLATGILKTIIGDGTAGFDAGTAPLYTKVNYPNGLALSAGGDLYFADYGNNRVRMLDRYGVLNTVAGTGAAGFSGDGGLSIDAQLNLPTGVCVDQYDNIYIADRNNYRIRKVAAVTWTISTVAGSGNYGIGGDGGLATAPCVKLADPHKVRIDQAGNLFISDQSNGRIRKIDTNAVNSMTPGITITGPSTVCKGTATTFTSQVINAGNNNTYQWKVNGVLQGIISAEFTSSTLSNGDQVSCTFTSLVGCTPVTINSNTFTVAVTDPVSPTISIAASQNNICAGGSGTFTSVVTNAGSSPFYQWQLNGANVGTNTSVFTGNFLNGDVVTCRLTSNAACAVPTSVSSNSLPVSVSSIVTPSVSITADRNSICTGGTVSFTAIPVNCGTHPSFSWKINGINAGTDSILFTSNTLADNDQVSCMVTVDPAFNCVTANTAVSNDINITVSSTPSPSVFVTASANDICPGTPVRFTASVQNAGSTPALNWHLNGISTDINTVAYNVTSLKNGDIISCMLLPGILNCGSTAVMSNKIVMTIKEAPVITITPSNASVKAGSQVQLSAAISGTVAGFQWHPPGLLTNASTLNTVTRALDSSVIFTLTATGNEGCSSTSNAVIKVFTPFTMPTAFTPNGDGLNDVFRIPPAVSIALKEFSVYDRWGNKVFSTSNSSQGWDGYYLGSPCNSGSFVYMVRGISGGKVIEVHDSFILTR